MARDLSLSLRQAAVTRLRADSGLTAIVPATRVYGERSLANTAWPFTRYGVSETLPRRGQCWDGSVVSFPVHSFSKQAFTDELAGINAAIAACLGDQVLDLGNGSKAHVRWTGSTILPDPDEADSFHGIVRFEATIA